MKLKYIVPNMAQTFGNLEFAGENDVLGRSVSSMSRKSSSSILRLPPRERTCEVVATQTIS